MKKNLFAYVYIFINKSAYSSIRLRYNPEQSHFYYRHHAKHQSFKQGILLYKRGRPREEEDRRGEPRLALEKQGG